MNPIEREKKIRQIADTKHGRCGEIEFDDDAKVSESDDNGAYVQAWVWVSFSGTELDKATGAFLPACTAKIMKNGENK